jgi:ABC-type sugar transport system substrate-binding protein
MYEAVRYLADPLDIRVIVDGGSGADAAIDAIENLIAAGADAIIAGATAGSIARMVEIAESHGVYLVAFNSNVATDPGFDVATMSPYFLGAVYGDPYAIHREFTSEIIAQGAQNFVLYGLPPGVSIDFDSRAEGAKDALRAAGIEYSEARGFAQAQIATDIFAQFPDTDAIIAITSGWNIYGPVMVEGRAGNVFVTTVWDDGDTAGAFRQGLVTHAGEGNNAQAMIAFALAYNALSGNPLMQPDGSGASILLPYARMRTAEEYEIYLAASTGGNAPITTEEIMNMIVLANPGATLADIEALAGQFSIEWLAARR